MILKRDESKLRNVPNSIPVIMFFDMIMCFVFGVIFLVSLVRHNISAVYIIPIIIGIAFGIFCDYFFNWYIGCKYDLKSNKIIYSYYLNGFGMGNNSVNVSIKAINNYKLSKNKQSCTVYGNVSKKMPLRPAKELNKFTLLFDFNSTDGKQIISKLDDLKEVN